MADLKYQVQIETAGAARSLDNLKNQILGFGTAIAGAFAFKELQGVGSRFQDLRTSLGLLYRDTALGAAAFDDIKKFAATSVFAVEDLTETVIKLKAAGLEPTVSQLRLFADVSSVAADSVGALQAITDLYSRTTAGGLGLEDLNRLADRGIPVFSILSDRLGISRLEISKVGQTAEGAAIILKALEDGLNDAFGGASVARAGNVSQAMSNMGDAFANAGDTIGQSGVNQGLADLYRAITRLIQAAEPVAKALGVVLGGALTALSKVIAPVTALVLGFISALVVSRVVMFGKAILNLTKIFGLFNAVVGKNPLVKVISVAAGAAAMFGFMATESDDLTEELKKLNSEADGLANNKGFKVFKEGELGGGVANLKEDILQFNEGLKAFKVDMDATVASFKRSNEEINNSVDLETQLLGTTTLLQRLKRSELDINTKLTQEVARLTEEKAKLTEAERKEGRGAVIDTTIEKLKKQAEIDKAAAAESIKNNEIKIKQLRLITFAVQSQIDNENKLREIGQESAGKFLPEIERQHMAIAIAAENSARAQIAAYEASQGPGFKLSVEEVQEYYKAAFKGVEDLIAAQTELNRVNQEAQFLQFNIKERISAENELQKILDERSKLTMTELQRQEYDLTASAKARAKAEIEAEEARRGPGYRMSAEEQDKYYNTALSRIEDLKAANAELYNQSRSFETGWKGAFNAYAEEATNAARQAERIFQRVTSSMEDMIVEFAKTGKFEFRGFLNSILEDLLRSQIRQLIAQIFNIGGSSGSSGGIFGSIGKLLGFANGGIIPTNGPVLVGERGPEILSGVAGRVVTPNDQIGLGTTNVTYNINAVDAASFKQLVARDPGFIYAVTLQGAKTIPTGRR